jgi:hypothetical protein
LSRPDPIGERGRLAALPRPPRDQDGAVFAEPWQAQAFALAVRLCEQGHLTWKEWAAALVARKEAWAEAFRRTPHGQTGRAVIPYLKSSFYEWEIDPFVLYPADSCVN